jgi:hypothetical protein
MNMNELQAFKIIAELTKKSIDNNPSFSEEEKFLRKCGVEQTEEIAKGYYAQQHRPIKELPV